MTLQQIKNLDNLPRFEPGSTVATIGTFDGIHLGHQAIFEQVNRAARAQKLRPVLVTFHPHPRVVVTPESIPLLLTTLEEKERFVPCFFKGEMLVLEFNDGLKNLTAEDFVRKILVDRLGIKQLIVGYDHHLGRDRGGTIAELQRLGGELGFGVEVVGPVIVDEAPVSSTRIRRAIHDNQFEEALSLLGHEYAIFGTVERGLGLGRKLGYPTANVKHSMRKLLPPEGVYACWVQIGTSEYSGMMFIGQNHFNPAQRVTVEANLFDFDRDIYDHEILLYPTTYIRPNRRFPSTGELKTQIGKDKERVIEILEKGALRNGSQQRK